MTVLMSSIFNTYPESVINARKYKRYLEMRKQYDKFLKNQREMHYIDWLIDKKLVEAGGLGKTIYILPARGGSRVNWGLLHELAGEGRDVQVVTTRRYEPKLYPADRKTIEDAIFQLKLYSLLAKPWQDPYYEALWNQLFPKDSQNTRREVHTANPYTDLASHWVYKSFAED